MMLTALGGALLLLAAETPGPARAETFRAAAAPQFAPPLDRPLAYRVTTRRLGRDGAMLSFSLVYALEWQQAGRGYRLIATLQRIESGARPELVRAVTGVLQPLVGERIAYLVAPDGSSIDLIDAAQLWDRVMARAQQVGDTGQPGAARQMAGLIAALPPAERDRAATADIRAIIAPANAAIAAAPDGAGVSVRREGSHEIVVKTEQGIMPGDGRPLQIDTRWTVDRATGLVIGERRQSFLLDPKSAARTLVEERERLLLPAETR